MVIEERIYTVIAFQHVKIATRSAHVSVKLKDFQSGAAIEKTLRPDEKFQQAILERKELEFLYKSGSLYHFMDMQTYDEVILNESNLSDIIGFFKENSKVVGIYCNDRLITVELPKFIELFIKETEPGVKGDTVKSPAKVAVLETGAEISVPLFIKAGDRIKIDTRTKEYIGRV